jgi:hypothetical protein
LGAFNSARIEPQRFFNVGAEFGSAEKCIRQKL